MNLKLSDFEVVGPDFKLEGDISYKKNNKKLRNKPIISIIILLIIVIGCFLSFVVGRDNPSYMDLNNTNIPPNSTFYFGTDSMGRDIFSMIFYGGRISLFIGILSTVIATFIGITYGSISGSSSEVIDDMMMRFTDIILSIPSILVIIFFQGVLGSTTPISISIVIGITSWMSIAKVIRSEVRQIRNSEYILAAKTMGGSFFYILKEHLVPNFISSIMFMVVTNIGYAITTESTLSFFGIGLPIEVISWGSMLSLAEQALLSNRWWMIIIPGIFLVTTLVCITNIGNYIRKVNNKKFNNLVDV